jgi:plastocyanin
MATILNSKLRHYESEVPNNMSFHQVSANVATLAAVILSLAGQVSAGEIKGKVTVHGMRSAENIAVYVDATAGRTFDPPAQHVVIDQRKMTFIPHVVVVLKGTTVDFLNSDPVGHNVYWPSVSGNKKLAHNLGTWPQAVKKSFQFNDLGVASLLCNVHPEMSGYVVVVPTPYFAVTDKEGNYTIKDVSAGTYTLKTWSEEGKPVTQSVNVSSGSVTADLSVQR